MTEDAARELQAPFVRMVWDRNPSVRLSHDPEGDVLIAKIATADATDEVLVGGRLLVEMVGVGTDARPVALYLTAAGHEGRARDVARELLGERVWDTAWSMRASGSGPVEVSWTAAEADERRQVWAQWSDRTGARPTDRPSRVIGIEFVPGMLHAVLTDGGAQVLDEETLGLTANDPTAVVHAITELVATLDRRRPDGQGCPIGVQLGGPVHGATGTVRHYDKPLHTGDEPWKNVPLGAGLRAATGREVIVVNDATALAVWENRAGLGRRSRIFAVIVVRRGVGAKLVRRGRVEEDFPMEIGVFVPVPHAALDETPDEGRRTIEAGSGGRAIVAAVTGVIGRPCATIEEAAALAETDERVAQVFWRAGAGLARALAAIQAVVDPDEWAIYGLPALVDERRVAGREFLAGVRSSTMSHLDYHGFAAAPIQSRPMFGNVGACAAAVAVLDQRPGRPDAPA